MGSKEENYAEYTGAGLGGSFDRNSTVEYVADGKAAKYVHQIDNGIGSPVLSKLETEDGDDSANRGLTLPATLRPGQIIKARAGKPFKKIQFSTAAGVTFWLI